VFSLFSNKDVFAVFAILRIMDFANAYFGDLCQYLCKTFHSTAVE